MLTIIIGETGVGKTAFAHRLSARTKRTVVSAGGWIRDRTGCHGHGQKIAEFLASESKAVLAKDPGVAVRWIESRLGTDRDGIVEGIRSPRDLVWLARPGDHIVDIGGDGVEPWERAGLTACRALRPWLAEQRVTWANAERHFAAFPEPVPTNVVKKWLFNQDESVGGVEPGSLVALESYPGERVTGMFLGSCGGSFHDLPLEAFRVPGPTTCRGPSGCAYPEEQCYTVADVGHPVIELPIVSDCKCSIFDAKRNLMGEGEVLWVMHWPQGNSLLYLTRLGDRLLLWPPHKLLFGDETSLPDWKKLRPA